MMTHGMDLNRAYKAFAYDTSAAHPWYKKYGFPVSGTEIAMSDPPRCILDHSGIALVELIDAHPYVQHQAGENKEVLWPTPLLKFLDENKLAEFRIIKAIVVAETHEIAWPDKFWNPSHEDIEEYIFQHGLETFPECIPKSLPRWTDEYWYRKALGRLIPANTPDFRVTTSEDEKNSMVRTLLQQNRRGPVCERIAADKTSFWLVGSTGKDVNKRACYHTHSFVLAYNMIAVMDELRK